MADESRPEIPEVVEPEEKVELSTGQCRMLVVVTLVVAAVGLLWWLLLTGLHVNIVPLGAGVLVLGLAGAFTVWTGLK